MKRIIKILVVVLFFVISGTIFIVPANFGFEIEDFVSLPGFVCSKEAQQVIRKYDISEIKKCQTFKSTLNNKEAKLVYLVSGPGMDCMVGCIYDNFYAIVQGANIYDMPLEPGLFYTLKTNFGDWCAFENRDRNWPNLKKFGVLENGGIRWAYNFYNFSTEDYWKDRMKNNEFEATIENPKNCILNGSLITGASDSYNLQVDLSKLRYSLEPMDNYTPKPLDQALDKCLSTRWSKLECYELFAIYRKDPQLCFGDYEKYLTDFHKKLYGDHNYCLDRVLDAERDVKICNKLTDKMQNTLCIKSFKEKMNKLHDLYPTAYPNTY